MQTELSHGTVVGPGFGAEMIFEHCFLHRTKSGPERLREILLTTSTIQLTMHDTGTTVASALTAFTTGNRCIVLSPSSARMCIPGENL